MLRQRQLQLIILAVAVLAFAAYIVPVQILQPVEADRGGESSTHRSTTGQAHCRSDNSNCQG